MAKAHKVEVVTGVGAFVDPCITSGTPVGAGTRQSRSISRMNGTRSCFTARTAAQDVRFKLPQKISTLPSAALVRKTTAQSGYALRREPKDGT